MKLFGGKNKDKLIAREKELLEQIRSNTISNEELLGPYSIPPTLVNLQKLQESKLISTQLIGFELWLDRPITPSSHDLIPFAITGGDSCYFAFITDYGLQTRLEECPIVFISPTDFDQKNPAQSNFLIAANIKEFLSLMISLKYADHLRFKNIYENSINEELSQCIAEFEAELTQDETDSVNKTITKLIEQFGIRNLSDFHKHFKSLKQYRSNNNYIPTLDGFNILNDSEGELKEINEENIENYTNRLIIENKKSALVAIRNAPYMFNHFSLKYKDFKLAILTVFEKFNLKREKKIQQFEIDQDELSDEWVEIRKQIMKK